MESQQHLPQAEENKQKAQLAEESQAAQEPQVLEAAPIPQVPEAAPTMLHAEEKPKASQLGLKSAKKLTELSPNKSVESTEQVVLKNEPVSLPALQETWVALAEEYKAKNQVNTFVLMHRPISLQETNIHLQLENEVQIKQFNETLRLELLQILREKFQNQQLDFVLEEIPASQQETKRLYTQEEKFDHLVQKHPQLELLKKTFGLDISY